MRSDEIIRMLMQGEGGFVSGQDISRVLGISRAAVWKAVKALIAQGYVIESKTNVGYRLVSLPSRLSAEGIEKAAGELTGLNIILLDSVDSTNTHLKRLALDGAPAGTVVVAERQSAGRGRFNREFYSPPGSGVYLSVLLRPELEPKKLTVLTAFSAVAVKNAIERVCGVKPLIKWTNDLIWDKRKLCGILTETSLESETGRVQYAVVGVGVNVNQDSFPEELSSKAASLKMAAGKEVSRELLIAGIIKEIFDMAENGLEEKRSLWLERYRESCMTVGRRVIVERGGEMKRGLALSIDYDAALIVCFDDGTVEAVNSGEVSVSGLYGYV